MRNKEKRYSMKEVKLFLENEINPVIKEYGVDVKVRLMTKAEYFDSDIYKNYCNDGAKDYADCLYNDYCGFSLKDNIVVFIEKACEDIKDGYNTKQIINLLATLFHELAHVLQKEDYNYYEYYLDLIYVLMDTKVMENSQKFYDYNWLNFFVEADADRFAYKALMEIMNKYPNLYTGNEEFLAKKNDNIAVRLNTYDFGFIFNQFDLLEKSFNSSNPIAMITGLIYKEDTNCFKSIEDIVAGLEEENFYELIYLVLGSEAFLRTVDFNSLSDKEIDIMIKAVGQNYDDYMKKNEVLKGFAKKCEATFYEEKTELFTKRMNQLNNTLSKLKKLKKDNKKLSLKK